MKIVAYTALAYGACYLSYAIKAAIDDVDEWHIIYTPTGSHGHSSPESFTDTRAELYALAEHAAGSKLRWHDGQWGQENQQRGMIHEYVPDADLIVAIDYDEIMQPGLLASALDTAAVSSIKEWRLPFRHYYRSFYRCILHDPAYPTRIVNPLGRGSATFETDKAVNHFGYAIPPKLMREKWRVHGHKDELRKDVDYFTDIYEANRQTDVHPVGSEYWNPETVDPFAEDWLPKFMRRHPYAGMEAIP